MGLLYFIANTGNAIIPTTNGSVNLPNTLHLPGICRKLLSIKCMASDLNAYIIIDEHGFILKEKGTGKTIARGPNVRGLYHLPEQSAQTGKAFSGVHTSSQTWYDRLGHPSSNILSSVLKSVPVHGSMKTQFCSTSASNKGRRLPFNDRTFTATRPLALLHLDLWGPAPVRSSDGFSFYLSVIDDFSRYCWVLPLTFKSDCFNQFIAWIKRIENLLQFKVTEIQYNRGGEFLNNRFNEFITSKDISKRVFCPHTPEQNGIAERKHQHIVSMGRCFLNSSKVPHKYWTNAFINAAFVANRLSTSVLEGKSPFQMLIDQSPDYSILKTFRCRCYPLARSDTSDLSCFVGYAQEYKGCICLSLNSGKVVVSRHAIFDEKTFPFAHSEKLPNDLNMENNSNREFESLGRIVENLPSSTRAAVEQYGQESNKEPDVSLSASHHDRMTNELASHTTISCGTRTGKNTTLHQVPLTTTLYHDLHTMISHLTTILHIPTTIWLQRHPRTDRVSLKDDPDALFDHPSKCPTMNGE